MENTRQTAYKLWIKDMVNGEFVKSSGNFDPNYINTRDLKVSRVNIIATVIYKIDDENYSSMVLEDSSGNIRVKEWSKLELLKDINIGDLVLIIGKPRQFNNEIYITPEIIKKLDNLNWLKVRELELTKIYGKQIKKQISLDEKSLQEIDKIEEITILNNRQRILKMIENLSNEDGVSYLDIMNNLGLDKEESQFIIEELLKEGEIFEVSEGKLKILR